LLLENGALVNAKNNYSDTPLMAACRSRNRDIVKLLLENKADVTAKDENNETALTHATRAGDQRAIDLLKTYGAK
jgi:ankyrin repeat protein